jgi:hypothetical protein
LSAELSSGGLLGFSTAVKVLSSKPGTPSKPSTPSLGKLGYKNKVVTIVVAVNANTSPKTINIILPFFIFPLSFLFYLMRVFLKPTRQCGRANSASLQGNPPKEGNLAD